MTFVAVGFGGLAFARGNVARIGPFGETTDEVWEVSHELGADACRP